MPIFTTPISTQNQAGAAGVYSTPQSSQVRKNIIIYDEFLRGTLNPSGAPAMYTETITGTGTNSTNANQTILTMTTSTAINDSNDVWTQGFYITRLSYYIDTRSSVNFDMIFSTNSTTNTQAFIGFVNTNAGLSSLPTTTSHLGIYVNTAVNSNFMLSSSDGTTQTTTNTGQAIDANVNRYRLNISYTGSNNAVISLYGPHAENTSTRAADFSKLIKSQTVTALAGGPGDPNDILAFSIHMFVKTLTTSSATFFPGEWSLSVT